MNGPIQTLSSARDRAVSRLILGNIVVLPRYFAYRVRRALQAAERRRVRRRQLALAGGTAVAVAGVVALRSAKHADDGAA